MRRRIWLLLALLATGCGKDAERLGRMCRLAGAKIENATGGTRTKLTNGFQAAMGETGMGRRVATRLRWDNAMIGADVRVLLPEPGTIQLEGTVISEEQRQRAADLATTTIGVEKVENELAVRQETQASRER